MHIKKRFIELCKEYATKSSTVFHSYESDKKSCTYTLFYNHIKIEFCYQIKATTLILPHTLYCRIYLQKNSVVYYHLPDILPVKTVADLKCCYFPYIESAKRMESCFKQLANIIDSHMDDIENAVIYKEEMQKNLLDTYVGIFSMKKDDIDFDEASIPSTAMNSYFCNIQKYREEYIVGRFTTFDGYIAFLSQDFEKSLKIYQKHSKKEYMLPYELKIIEFLTSSEEQNFKAIDDECFSQKEAKSIDIGTDMELLKLIGISLVLFGIPFCALFAISNAVLSQGSIFFFGCPWYGGFSASGICAVFGAIAFRIPLKNIFLSKTKKSNPEMQKLISPKGLDIFAKFIFAIALAFTICTSAMMLLSYAKFNETTFTFNTSNDYVKMATYNYDDIKGVYYINARYNADEERIERPSYVILLNDGEYLDLDCTVSVKKSEKTVIPFLKDMGFDITVLDSSRELKFQ